MKYFVNVNTGELKHSETEVLSPFMHPAFNVEGWSQVDVKLYALLMLVFGYGYVHGAGDNHWRT
jgi:hypothetical protein